MKTAMEVYPLVSLLHDMARYGMYEEIDGALRKAPLEKMTPLAMVAVIRTTFSFRTRLKEWRGLRDRILKELQTRSDLEASPQKLLRGLFREEDDDFRDLHRLMGIR